MEGAGVVILAAGDFTGMGLGKASGSGGGGGGGSSSGGGGGGTTVGGAGRS